MSTTAHQIHHNFYRIDGCLIHEGLTVKRALLFATQPLLRRLGPVVPAGTRCECPGNRRVDQSRRVPEDPVHTKAASELYVLEAVRGDSDALRVVPDRVHRHARLVEDLAA